MISAAVTLMRSVTASHAQMMREARPQSPLGQSMSIAASPPKDMKAVNDYYFGNHLTPTEAMFYIFERMVGYLNEKLGLGRDGDEAETIEGNVWRDRVLRENIDVGSDKDFSIPRPGEEGFSFRQVARMIDSAFNLDSLSRDRGLIKELEDMLGFRLDGMTVADLVQSFIDPAGKSAEKVNEVIAEGLAGQTGSKTMQRLEDVAAGPKSIEDVMAGIEQRNATEVVDEETIEEDRKAISDAKAMEKLQAVQKMQDAMEELNEADLKTGKHEAAAGSDVEMALRIVQTLASDTDPDDVPVDEDGAPADATIGEEEDHGEAISALAKAYRESIAEEETPRFRMLM